MSHPISGRSLGGGPRLRTECWSAPPAPRRPVSYWCPSGHATPVVFAADADTPPRWDCRRCGRPAGLDPDHPPTPDPARPLPKTPLEHVRDRRSDTELDQALTAALTAYRAAAIPAT